MGLGLARLGLARLGLARLGLAGLGLARLGLARLGLARLGLAGNAPRLRWRSPTTPFGAVLLRRRLCLPH